MKNYVKKYKGHDVPEGAAYYAPEESTWSESFFNKEKIMIAKVNSYGVLIDKAYSKKTERNNLIELPTEEEWMPKAGEKCEVSEENNEYQKCYYIGKSKDGWDVYEISCSILVRSDSAKFRPVTSKRERFIDWSVSTTSVDGATDEERYRDLFGAQYDNGARIVGAEDE